jgi:hypothetical protein
MYKQGSLAKLKVCFCDEDGNQMPTPIGSSQTWAATPWTVLALHGVARDKTWTLLVSNIAKMVQLSIQGAHEDEDSRRKQFFVAVQGCDYRKTLELTSGYIDGAHSRLWNNKPPESA